jgi:VWFA-related protein
MQADPGKQIVRRGAVLRMAWRMAKKSIGLTVMGLALLLGGLVAGRQVRAQQDPQKPQNAAPSAPGQPNQAQQNQDIPDAPSAARPIPPPELPSAREQAQGEGKDEGESSSQPGGSPKAPQATSNEFPGGKSGSEPDANDAGATELKPTPPPPMPPVRTVPEGSVPKDLETRDDLYTVSKVVNFVLVPVTVKDGNGRLVNGLLPKDIVLYENGQKQPLKFFTSDPFPLSAAVVLDLGMADVGVRKVQETVSALQGAFTPYDEVGIYTYSSTVHRVAEYTPPDQRLKVVLGQVKTYTGANNGVPVTSGPLAQTSPVINGRPIDSPVTPVVTPPKESRVLNDAILAAARDLSQRDRARRKIIFVISDGREYRSTASYADTLKVLLTQNIIVYAIGLEGAAIPGYGTLQKVHLPKLGKFTGYSNLLPKYVNATGGGRVYSELSQADIEKAYGRAVGDARNQYTLGYTSKPGIGGYRRIEVVVKKPGLTVYAKDGYYPLPSPR